MPQAVSERANRGGRPSSYRPAYVRQARELCRLGATDADLARFFDVTTMTILNWKSKYRDFNEALQVGKGLADEKIKRSLFQRAQGYEYHEEIIQIFRRTKDEIEMLHRVNANRKDGDPYVKVKDHFTVREVVTRHVPADVKAADIWLKNRMPDEFLERFQHVHSGSITHNHPSSITDGNVRQILAQGLLKLAARREDGDGEVKVIEHSLRESNE